MNMSAILLDGKELSAKVRESIRVESERILPLLGRKPGLAVVLVGENPASKVYVASKSKAAEACGFLVLDRKLPAEASDADVQSVLRELSEDPNVDGILLQLPLPKGLDESQALLAITPEKDADGLHPATQGLLLRGEGVFIPCTPQGCMALIDEAAARLGIELAGKKALVIGRSILVGKPVSLLLLERNCTVTMAHSKTVNLREECLAADILVAAVGRPEFIKGDWIKPGAVVIDVGINRLEDKRIAGDVDFAGARERASAITPVPGGVGPMTIAMLLKNTLQSAKLKINE